MTRTKLTPLTPEQHVELGNRLKNLKTELIDLTYVIGPAYGRKLSDKLLKGVAAVDYLRNDLDSKVGKEVPSELYEMDAGKYGSIKVIEAYYAEVHPIVEKKIAKPKASPEVSLLVNSHLKAVTEFEDLRQLAHQCLKKLSKNEVRVIISRAVQRGEFNTLATLPQSDYKRVKIALWDALGIEGLKNPYLD